MKGKAADIGSRLELFVDEELIERLTGARLRLHHPVPREIALSHDAPWEGNCCGSYRVLQQDRGYRMYYRGQEQMLKGEPEAHPPVTCLAESADGVHWHKPELHLVEFAGSKRNNIVYEGPHHDTFVPFRDSRPDCRPEAMYKSVGAGERPDGSPALFAFQSADGLYWEPLGEGPSTAPNLLKMQNLVFRDAYRGDYRAYWRAFRDPVTNQAVDTTDPEHPACIRDIVTATSHDLLHWSEPVFLDYPGAPDEQIYTNPTTPYFRAPHLFVGFPVRYIDRGWSDSTRALPGLGHRRRRAANKQREGTALTEALFMTSRDGVAFKRWREAFIRPGLRTGSNWVYGDNYPAWGIITTPSATEEAPDELSIFASERYWQPGGSRLRRFSLRVDGFVSVQAPGSGGEMVTAPLVFAGERLVLNFSTSAAGSIRVEIQDGEGRPLEGYALEDCADLFGDDLERTATWKNGPDVGRLAGRAIKLRFVMEDADLYSMRFSAPGSGLG